jgi:hypothetical protein
VFGPTSVGPGDASSQAVITVSTPEVPNPTSESQLSFDGSETINVKFTAGGLNYNVTWGPSNFTGTSNVSFTGTSSTLSTPVSTWNVSNNLFQVFELQTGTPTNSSPTYSKYSRLTEWTYPGSPSPTYGYQIIGDVTPVANMPTAGTASYAGQAYGQADNVSASTAGVIEHFTGTVMLNVNFSSATLNGGITDIHVSAGGDPNLERSVIGFNGTISGNTFSGTVLASGPGVQNTALSSNGTFKGGFYGPSSSPAAEAAGVFAASSNVVGGFVAKKQ